MGRGDILEDNMNLEDLLWDAHRWLQEHCRMVAAEAGTHIAATIQSWTPVNEVDYNFIKIRAHPKITDELLNELKNSLLGTVIDLV